MLLESVYVLAHFFAPFVPAAAEAIFKKLGTPPRPIPTLADTFMNLTTGTTVTSGSVLFAVHDVKADTKAALQPSDGKKEADAAKDSTSVDKGKGGKDAKKETTKGTAPKPVDDPNQPLVSKLEVRVGKIMKAWHHPEADRLFCEEVDVGEPSGARQIVSGLREHYTLEEFQGKKVLVVCNMKPAKLKNVMSSGMVLCAKNPETKVVELLGVPEDCKVGDRVLPEGVPMTWAPADPSTVKKLGLWEEMAKDLRTDAGRVACYAGKPLTTEAGVKFLAPTLPDSVIG
jgi:methionine--tRNA ligase beta chain